MTRRVAQLGLGRLFSQAWLLAAALCLVLFIANAVVQPAFVEPINIERNLTLFAPLALLAMASTPAILTGGIDISLGPLMGLVNIIIVAELLPPELGGPVLTPIICIGIGLAVGLLNGVVVAIGRIEPVVATIGTFLVLSGVDIKLLPVPKGPAPDWAVSLGIGVGPLTGAVILLSVPVIAWIIVRRLPFHTSLLAVGGDEGAAFSTGLNTTIVKIIAYGIGGAFAAVAGIALTTGLSAADALIGPRYTIIAIAAVALGGTSLAGGQGGLTEAFLGALVIFLIQGLLTALGLTSLWLPLVYGSILIASLIFGAQLTRRLRPERGQA